MSNRLPSKIEAIKKYGSPQDQYKLLSELVDGGVLEKEIISPRNVRYHINDSFRTIVWGLERLELLTQTV